MLYGNIIFLKKTGGDGSKYPVTEKNIKIGRSENCLIRIYNPQVAPEHCQLIIDCNGQVKLRNLFTPMILNGKPLGQGDVTLCHGDVFKLGERLARWEYLPTSKYFRQLLSPTGRLVAVVNPQRRSVDTSGISSAQVSVSKNTPLGSKRKLPEKCATERPSTAKQRKTVGLDPSLKPKIDLGKLLIGRHSIKSGKLLLKTPLVKQRKSTSGAIGSRTSKTKLELSRKSTLPSWKVSVDTQPKKSPPKGAAKTPSKKSLKSEVRTPSKSTPIKLKTPKRLKLDTKSGNKSPLKTIMESPPKPESVRPTRSFSKSPQTKITPKRKSPTRLVKSEQKPGRETSKPIRKSRKMSLVFTKIDSNEGMSESDRIISGKKSAKGKKISSENEAQVEEFPRDLANDRKSSAKDSIAKSDASFSSGKSSKKSVKNTPVKTPRNFSKSSVKKTGSSEAPPLIDFSDDSVNSKRTSHSSVKSLQKSVKKSSARSLDNFEKITKKVAVEQTQSVSTPGSRKSGKVTSSKKVVGSSKDKEVFPKGVRRKLSLSISSAERAAKKLKTSSPRKPDKNKRAALLVLGKASRKQLLSQNVKVLLKQKIVKKALKQSVALPIRKVEKKKTAVKKEKKVTQKKNKKSPGRISQIVKNSPVILNEDEPDPNVKKSPERNSLSKSKISSPVPSSAGPAKSPGKKTDSILSVKSTNETISPFVKFDKSFIFNSNRRCSKRLSSKNDTERPDFVELSPTALGLIPKNMAMFKTPKERNRQSSSLVTPRNFRTTGIIKSASTSKIGNRKSVSFSSKELSFSTTTFTPFMNEKTDFDFDSFHTSNITMDVFVSPLNKTVESSVGEFDADENTKPSEKRKSSPKKVARRLLQTPAASKSLEEINLWNVLSDSGVAKPIAGRSQKSSKNCLSDVRGVRQLLATPRQIKSPKNNLSDVKGVKKLFATPKVQKSPKNDLSDVKGVKKLMQTPKVQKSPKNDLSDVRGVKKLMKTPKIQKSPKNDLSDMKGVKKLMRTPKVQKSPKNDLSDLKGVKRLMRTPKVQKSPKNDLSDLRGVKKLMRTPKVQKSPKNDLSDLKGVKRLMRTPKEQKSPKNDLTDVRGVKRLLQSPKNQKSPKNDLTDVTGVKQLLKTPKAEKRPRNNSSDVEGLKQLFASPQQQKNPKAGKTIKGPKNDLTDVSGVRELFSRHKPISDYNVSLTGVAELFETENENSEGEKSLKGKPVKGRGRKLNVEKEQKVTPEKGRTRVTRSTKADAVVDAEEKASKGSKKTVIEKPKTVKKVTRTKKEAGAPKEEAPKSSRKRKYAEALEISPPKLRRKTAATAKQTASKIKSEEPKTPVKSKTRKAEKKDEAKGLKKAPGKSKTPAKKPAKVQSKAIESGAKIQKVQKGRSQNGSKQEPSKSRSKASPRKTRSVVAKTRTTGR